MTAKILPAIVTGLCLPQRHWHLHRREAISRRLRATRNVWRRIVTLTGMTPTLEPIGKGSRHTNMHAFGAGGPSARRSYRPVHLDDSRIAYAACALYAIP